ncbi:hypothetical protein CAPTEDRAFT_210871 [Capitella teleta]|uniref:Fibrinogen C-terminal domain-containing protein n=1 Tax=Capitella teleta TaxID=283909 RepID=R7TY65_CAPTE|nr:hypothetical protein CAPTEDRAFT_210871 [Capitella teleta]|eukprot:ELT98828.1 hypothetical protein CAPTEDRAFT_210871 [Capitella teleta]
MLGDRMSAMEGRMTAQIASIMELMTSQSSTVRDFNQLYLELRDQDARVMESQLVEMRQIVQSAVDHLSATEERIATANAAMEDRLISNHAVLSENLTSLMTNFTEHLTAEMGDRINDLENRTRVERRNAGSQDFFRNWAEYAAGFGDLNGEFWLAIIEVKAVQGIVHLLRIDNN